MERIKILNSKANHSDSLYIMYIAEEAAGITAVIELQKMVNVRETVDSAKVGWNKMSKSQKAVTISAYEVVFQDLEIRTFAVFAGSPRDAYAKASLLTKVPECGLLAVKESKNTGSSVGFCDPDASACLN